MMRFYVSGALAALLCACQAPVVRADKPEPVPAQCDAQCFVPCDTRLPPWRPADPDSPRAWDELGEQVLAPARFQLEVCELHRRACHECLDRHRKAGVLR